jgi:hypothetical protein
MCCKALARYRSLAAELQCLDPMDNRYEALFEQAEEASVEPVIFAGMCLEATLYDLGACLFGDDFAEALDRLDPVAKFVVLAQYIDQEVPSKSTVTYQSLQALVKARNKLVHHKSQPGLSEDFSVVLGAARKEHEVHMKGVDASLKALVLLSMHFDGNIFEELRILPSFKKPEYWNELVPASLHDDVRWCMEKSAKAEHRQIAPATPLKDQ